MLLGLARAIAARAGDAVSADGMRAVIDVVGDAYAPHAPLATALRQAWLRGRGEKTATLALGWAREQVRLALVEVLTQAAAAGLVRTDVPVDTVAWLWLAAGEALAHEPPDAVRDRVQAFAAFLSGSA